MADAKKFAAKLAGDEASGAVVEGEETQLSPMSAMEIRDSGWGDGQIDTWLRDIASLDTS